MSHFQGHNKHQAQSPGMRFNTNKSPGHSHIKHHQSPPHKQHQNQHRPQQQQQQQNRQQQQPKKRHNGSAEPNLNPSHNTSSPSHHHTSDSINVNDKKRKHSSTQESDNSNEGDTQGNPKSWSGMQQRDTTLLKTIDRRIEFRPPVKPENGFQNTINGLKDKSSSLSSSSSGLPDKKASITTKSKQDLGLFDAELIQQYAHWQKIIRIGPGLRNFGNTCFLNSTLQCLFYVPSFNQILLRESSKVLGSSTDGLPILRMFQSLLQQVWHLPGKAITPRSLVQNIRMVGKHFRSGRQEDAHEYLRLLLDCMHEELLKYHHVKISDGKIAESTFIGRVFGGNLRNELRCPTCGFSSKTYNHFQDLSLEVSGGISSVQAAISAYTKPEKLSAGNEWKCDGCKKKVQATKQLTISSSPSTLVMHLKRFSPFGASFGKIGKHIAFDTTIEVPVSEESTPRVSYNLVGVIVHHGSTVHSGHYVAFIKASNGSWYLMDDEDVSVCSSKTVLNQKAYVLFYSRASQAGSSTLPGKPSSAQDSTAKEIKENSVDDKKRKFSSDSLGTAQDDEPVGNDEEDEDVGQDVSSEDEMYGSSGNDEEYGDHDDYSGSEDDLSASEPPRKKLYLTFGLFKRKKWGWADEVSFRRRIPLRRSGWVQYKLEDSSVADGGDAQEKCLKISSFPSLQKDQSVISHDEGASSGSSTDEESSSSESSTESIKSSEDSNEDSNSEAEEKPVKKGLSNEEKYRRGSAVVELVNPGKLLANSTVAKDILFQSRRGREIGGEGLWADDDADVEPALAESLKEELKAIETKHRRQDQQESNSKKSKEWDRMLDSGKVKKVKVKQDEPASMHQFGNQFQKVLDNRRQSDNDDAALDREDYSRALPKHSRPDKQFRGNQSTGKFHGRGVNRGRGDGGKHNRDR